MLAELKKRGTMVYASMDRELFPKGSFKGYLSNKATVRGPAD
jgi:hypothetical protein